MVFSSAAKIPCIFSSPAMPLNAEDQSFLRRSFSRSLSSTKLRTFIDRLWGSGKNLLDDQEIISPSNLSPPNSVHPIAKCPYSTIAQHPVPCVFQMPLHYPRFSKIQYETMPEWQLDRLLEEYGLPAADMGSLEEKRQYAIGAFLWGSDHSL